MSLKSLSIDHRSSRLNNKVIPEDESLNSFESRSQDGSSTVFSENIGEKEEDVVAAKGGIDESLGIVNFETGILGSPSLSGRSLSNAEKKENSSKKMKNLLSGKMKVSGVLGLSGTLACHNSGPEFWVPCPTKSYLA